MDSATDPMPENRIRLFARINTMRAIDNESKIKFPNKKVFFGQTRLD